MPVHSVPRSVDAEMARISLAAKRPSRANVMQPTTTMCRLGRGAGLPRATLVARRLPEAKPAATMTRHRVM